MKSTILSLLLAAPALAMAQAGDFTIKGKVAKLNDPAIAFLRYAVDGDAVTDSVVLKDGAFEFKGKVPGPTRASIILYHEGKKAGLRVVDALTVFLEPATIKLSSNDSLKSASIKGSSINTDNQALNEQLKGVTAKSSALNDKYRALTADQRKDKAIMADLEKESDAIGEERKVIQKAFIDKHPDSYISLDALRSYAGYAPEYEPTKKIFDGLSERLRTSTAGVKYAESLDKVKFTSIGAIAPEFTQNDTSGIPVKLASFRGKYVLIDFWASWCGPCRAENPNVVKAFNNYKDKNFTVLGVSLDQPTAKDKWLKAIYADNLAWTHVSDLKYWKNDVAVQYGIQAIPQNFLIDPQGKIIAKNIRGEELEKKLGEFIN